MRIGVIGIASAMAAVLASAAQAQSGGPAGALPPLLPEAEEVALAVSAAPPDVSGRATVYVLRRGGHVKVRDGTSGVTCLVQRDHPESLYPICYDVEASRTVLPIALAESRLREQGKGQEEIEHAVALAVSRGELRAPSGPAMSYMMSPRQVIYAGARGPRVGAWRPHVMFHMPYLRPAQLGIDGASVPGVMVREPGTLSAHLIVVTPTWSDGRPAP